MTIDYVRKNWVEVHYVHMWKDLGSMGKYDGSEVPYVNEDGEPLYYKAYKGADQELTDLTTFNEYGWKYYLEKYLKNDNDLIQYFKPTERSSKSTRDTIYLESIHDIDTVRKTAFPTRYYGRVSEERKNRRYFGSIVAGSQKIYMIEVPPKISIISLTGETKITHNGRDRDEVRQYTPMVNITFSSEEDLDEFNHSKLLWVVMTLKEDEEFDIEISRIAFDHSENPYRNLRRYLFSRDENDPIEVVQEIDGRVYDTASKTLLGNKRLNGYTSLSIAYTRMVGNNWSPLITYKKGETVSYYPRIDEYTLTTYISQTSENIGNIPGISPYWVKEEDILMDRLIYVGYKDRKLSSKLIDCVTPGKISFLETKKNNSEFELGLRPIDGYIPSGEIYGLLNSEVFTESPVVVQYLTSFDIANSDKIAYKNEILRPWIEYYYKKNILGEEVGDYIPYKFKVSNEVEDWSTLTAFQLELKELERLSAECKANDSSVSWRYVSGLNTAPTFGEDFFVSVEIVPNKENDIIIESIVRHHYIQIDGEELRDTMVKEIINYEKEVDEKSKKVSIIIEDVYDVPCAYVYEITYSEALLTVTADPEDSGDYILMSARSLVFEKPGSKNILFKFNDNLLPTDDLKITLDKENDKEVDEDGNQLHWKEFTLTGEVRENLTLLNSDQLLSQLIKKEDTENAYKVDVKYIPGPNDVAARRGRGRSAVEGTGDSYYSISTDLLTEDVLKKLMNLKIKFKKE